MRAPVEGFRGHLVTAIAGIVIGLGIGLFFYIWGGGINTGADYKVNALVQTAGALAPGSRVTMAGAHVGRVDSVVRHGVGTEIRMTITDGSVTPVPTDTRVTLRQRTPVGENYVSLAPGRSSQKLQSGGTLPQSQSDEYVDVDQILSVLRGTTRLRARELFQSMGGALDGRGGQLNKLLGGTGRTVYAGARVLHVLSDDRRNVTQLVDRLQAVAGAVDERSATIRTIADKGLASMRALGARDAALRDTLDALPSTLAQVRTTSGKLQAVTGTATPVVADLADALREVRPSVRTLRPAAQQGREVVRDLSSAAPGLETTMQRLRTLSGPLTKALPDLHKALCEVNPMVRYLKPYTKDVIASVVGLGSASNSYDAIGHLIRLEPIIGENSLAGAPESVTKAAYTLLRTGVFQKSSGLTWNPYPEPGKVGNDGAGSGKAILGPKQLGESGYKFPHVLSDC